MNPLWQALFEVRVPLLLAGLALVIALLIARPSANVITESLRLMPDLVRLVARLARDQALPREARVRLGLLLACLAFPLDLIPDVVPVLGYADDVIVVLWALRSVIRAVGEEAIVGTGPVPLLAVRRCSASPKPGGALPPNQRSAMRRD